MRARIAILMALAAIVGSLMTAPLAHAQAEVTLSQQNQEEGDSESGGSGNRGDEGQQGEGGGESDEAAEETGPPWTYQMARISLILLFLTLLAVGFAYYRFVATRRKHGF